jgi:hypothetical protein
VKGVLVASVDIASRGRRSTSTPEQIHLTIRVTRAGVSLDKCGHVSRILPRDLNSSIFFSLLKLIKRVINDDLLHKRRLRIADETQD